MKKLLLPTPRSPAELDEKILAYAKRKAPDRKFNLRPVWLSGLVTASVVAVAVLIAIPQQPQPRVSDPEVVPERRRSDMPASAARSLEKKMSSQDTAGIAADYAVQERFAGPSVAPFDKGSLPARIEELARILENGDAVQAEAAYESLKNYCDSCELPDTLKEAIKKYLSRP